MKIKVIELFAGVGGFRLGLQGWQGKSPSSGYKKAFNSPYEVVWSNQWEPSTKTQHASIVYENRWGKKWHSNDDIASVPNDAIPPHDMLVGGFPCQDYSVATTLKNSKGLIGKKGVLWWSIHKILSETKKPTKYLFLENVDRLLISPASQRGRDFAIILQSLYELGYAVEWKVINAADYGMPQKRKRVYILGYHKSTPIYKKLIKEKPKDWILNRGVFPTGFETKASSENSEENCFELEEDIVKLSNSFNKGNQNKYFENSGVMINGTVYSIKTSPIYKGEKKHLGHILIDKKVEDEFYISDEDKIKWESLKKAKSEERTNSAGIIYYYKEGGMSFPDPLDRPARTIITGEGGRSPSRFKHAVESKTGLRRLTPIELERVNMFPDNHTNYEGISNTKRAFFMGNALVVGVLEKIGIALQSFIK